jgi:hypothetical protein
VGFWDIHNVEYYEVPTAWFYLAAAGDPRAYDLLIKGLHSQNPMIAGMAAWGLAKLQDHRAIDELIATGHQVPGEARACIVRSLVYFDVPKAQAAAEQLMPEKEKTWWRSIAAKENKTVCERCSNGEHPPVPV